MRGYEFRAGIESMAHKVCSALGLHPVEITWTNIPTAAISENGNILLANVADDAIVGKPLVNKYAGYIVHELLHRKYTNFRARDGRAYVDRLHNAIEDAWIERKGISAGLTGNIETLLRTLADGLADQALASASDWSDPAQYPFALALWSRGFCKRVPIPANLVPIFDEAQRRVDVCLNSKDTLKLAKWVFDQINQQPQQQPRQQPKQPDNGSETAPEGAQGDESEGEGGTEGENKNAQPTVDQPSKPVSADAESMEVEPSIPVEGGSNQPAFKPGDLGDQGEHLGAIANPLTAFNAGRLRYEVRRLFENSAFDDFAVNRKSGSLNVTALHRINTSDKLFKRHQEHEGIDSAVVILLDVSSSMADAPFVKIGVARDAAAALYETLSRAGVAVSVMAFSHVVSVPVPFGTPLGKARNIISRIKSSGSTADYEALRHAHQMILRRPESRKVVFALTDGEGRPLSARNQIDIGTRAGVTTVGIGIMTNVGHVYPDSIRVDNLSDLASASFNRIKLAA
jgi:cobalamin biosynthesis protein CobT